MGVFETDGVVVAGLFDNPGDRVLRVCDVSEILLRHGALLTRTTGAAGTIPSTALQQEQALIDLIVGRVDPATWIDAPTPQTNARIVSWRGRLLILQSPQVHRDVWSCLHHVLQYGPNTL